MGRVKVTALPDTQGGHCWRKQKKKLLLQI